MAAEAWKKLGVDLCFSSWRELEYVLYSGSTGIRKTTQESYYDVIGKEERMNERQIHAAKNVQLKQSYN